MRGGDTSAGEGGAGGETRLDCEADHVDIMGNRHMINDVLMIASVTKDNDCGDDDDSDGDGDGDGDGDDDDDDGCEKRKDHHESRFHAFMKSS